MNDMRLDLYRNPARRAVEFYLFEKLSGGKIGIATPIVFKVTNDDALVSDPTFIMDEEAAQNFIDQLWQQGFRPREGDISKALELQNKHLEDMRRIAFMFLEREGKG